MDNVGLFSRHGNEFDVYSPAPGMALPAGTYVLRTAQNRGLYLEKVDDIPVPSRVYGHDHSERIMRAYLDRPSSTGVWLNGEKGSGKTMFAAVLSKKMREIGRPTILIQSVCVGPAFNLFVEHVGEACYVFDEFEKVYNEDEHQTQLLTLFGGSVVAKNLYIVTSNSASHVCDMFRNRPSRFRYFIEYNGVSDSAVEEYVGEKLNDKSKVPEVIKLLSMIPNCNFDIMMCVVEEHNRFGGDPKELLAIMNASRGFSALRYSVLMEPTGAKASNTKIKPRDKFWVGQIDQENQHATVDLHFVITQGGNKLQGYVEIPHADFQLNDDESYSCEVDDIRFTLRKLYGFSNKRQEF